MLKKIVFLFFFMFLLIPPAWADTREGQFQLNGGLGVFVGTEGLGASFDFSLEPEFFLTEHNAIALRMDFTAGKLDSFHIGGRWRYYFDLPNDRVNLYVGLGMGGIVNFHGGGFGDAAIPVFGWQYDLSPRFKIGSDVSFDMVFNGNNVAFASRLMPVVFKGTF